MAQENLRDSNDPDEIQNIIQELSEAKAEITLWQNKENERCVIQGFFKSVDTHGKIITVGLKNKGDEFNFEEGLPVFFREDSKKLIFRQNISITSKKLIDAKFPDSIKLIDRRLYVREFYQVGTEGSSGQMAFIKVKSQTDNSWKEIECDLYDIGNAGLAVKLRPQVVKYFQPGSEVEIVSVKGKEFEDKVSGTVAYIKTYEDAKKNHTSVFHRMGVAFNREVFITKQNAS